MLLKLFKVKTKKHKNISLFSLNLNKGVVDFKMPLFCLKIDQLVSMYKTKNF